MKTFKTIEGAEYYKYQTTTFTPPKLTANNVIQNGFRVDNYYDAYYPNTGSVYKYWDEYVGWIVTTMYYQYPINPTKFTFNCLLADWHAASSAAYHPQIYGSFNGSIWDFLGEGPTVYEGNSGTINISTTRSYNYFQFKVRQGGWSGEDALKVSNFRLWGTYKITVAGTPTDYDLIGGQYKIQAFKLDKKYYMIKGDY